MKKKILFVSSIVTASSFSILPVISCSNSSSVSYKVMTWEIDDKKVSELKKNYSSFNSEPVSLDKLKKIIKTKTNDPYIDPYTKEAFKKGWFEQIYFDGKPGSLVIKLKSEQKINNKTVSCQYRLPNRNLTMKVS